MVNERIAPGLKGEGRTVVCEHNVAGHVDRFSTPSMIALMEGTSVNAVHHLLDPDQTTVGYEVNIRHLAPASIGAQIIAYSELTDVDKNRLTFKVEAYDGDTKIGDGSHRRAIIHSEPRMPNR